MTETNLYAAPLVDDLEVINVNDTGYTLASPFARLGAIVVEGVITAIPVFILAVIAAIFIPAFASSRQQNMEIGDSGEFVFLGFFSMIFFLSLIYTIINIVLLAKNGQTIGKKIMGIKIVRNGSHKRAGFWRIVLLRYFLNGLIQGAIGIIPGAGLLYFLVDSLMVFRADHQCLHDKIADTVVVNCRR